METETARYRSTETRHGGPVRWFIDQAGAGRLDADSPVGAALDKVSAWPEKMLKSMRTASAKKRIHAAMEQAELWPASCSADTGAMEREAITPDLVVETAAPREEAPLAGTSRIKDAPPRMARPMTRRPAPVAAMAAPAVPANNIARFLNVNGAIEGMRTGGIRFDLPGRGLSKTLRLWRGTPETSECTPVFF